MFEDLAKIRHALLHEIPKQRFLVVGDIILDRYLSGPSERLSQEAPVPVIRLASTSMSLGGAANVAHSLARLGSSVRLFGLVGEDEAGRDVVAGCSSAGIDGTGICSVSTRRTSVKTRVLVRDHQIARIDDEVTEPIEPELEDQLLVEILMDLSGQSVSAVILSDYAKGLCTPAFCQRLIKGCAGLKVPVYVDPKGVDYRKYKGATAIKPNRHEMKLVAQTEGWNSEDRLETAKQLRELLDLKFLALTLGPGGMILIEPDSEEWFQTAAREVFDVSGAGDAVLAAVACGLHGNLSLRESIVLGNLAAAQVVSKVGCVPIDRADLILAVQRQTKSSAAAKRFDLDELVQISDAWKKANQRVALTSGVYDTLQADHIRSLEEASANSDRLIVAVHEGQTSQTTIEARIEVLAALQCVDAIVVLDEPTAEMIVDLIKPDLLAMGS
jgi:D-beta-D-heptose 7-phosphate kinase/D-beta-D-heptose 1-phosphate adenosyltransferase